MSIFNPARIEALKAYGILDAPDGGSFERLTRLAARHFGMPLALVTLANDTYKVQFPFCAETVLDRKVMIVPDMALDQRFAGSPLVVGKPHIRFYAGAPMQVADGTVVGTFCILDMVPHAGLEPEAQRDLEDFAALALHELEMRAAARRLRESLALSEGVLAATTDPIFVKDRQGRYLTANAATARVLGVTREFMVGRRDEEMMPPDVAARLTAIDTRLVETGEAVSHENEVLDRGLGEPRTFLVTKTPLRDPDGGVVGLVGVARDITDRKRTERALRTSERRFRALVEYAPQMMWVNRADGALEFFNSAWRTYTGQASVEETRWEILHPDDRERVRALRDAAIAAGEAYEYEMRLRRADGAYRVHLGRVNPMRDEGREDGPIVAWVGTAMDVDDIRRAQEASEQANRSKSRFLAAASHDLRQPLQSILLFAEALQPHVGDQAGREKMDHLQRGLDTLKGLLDSLLDVSRLDAGIVTPQVEEFPVAELLEELKESYAPVAEAKGLDWMVVPCAVTVRSDRVLLGRMLRNLVENAVRYTERGRILIDGTVDGGHLNLEVRDTGVGIPAEQLERIWEEFHQVGNSERDRSQGLGLGLAIVRRLSTLLGHPVSVASQPGRGSIFGIRIPAAGTIALPLPAAEAPDARENRQFTVVVDDDAIVLLGLQAMIREWGHDVLAAGSTDQAMDKLKAAGRRPDLVIVDYRLRDDRVGTEAVMRIRDLYGRDIPGIILTGEIGPEAQRDAAAHGLGLMHKPVTARQLQAVVAHHLPADRPPGDGSGVS